MSEPTLAWDTTATDAAWQTEATQLFTLRSGYEASGQDELFDAWTAWAATSGDSDQKAIADVYSSYSYAVWLDLNGLPSFTANTDLQTGLPNDPVPGWYGCGNGVCNRDEYYGMGGWCFFFWADECGNTYDEPITNTGIYAYSMTDADFDTYITGITAVEGFDYYTGIAAGKTVATGVDYFDAPVCSDVSAGADETLWKCILYQPQVDQEADGRPRFNAPQDVTWYSVVGFPDDGTFDFVNTIRLNTQGYIWEGASTLQAAAVAVVATMLAF